MDTALNNVWKNNPELIRDYYEMIPNYKRLCDEIEYILDKKISISKIAIGSMSARAKSLSSFCEKIERKNYENASSDVTDFSGVRIVFLYASDRVKLERLVEDEFEIVEKVDKATDKGIERFGYGALHYIVRLKEQHAGARYDDLRGLNCEIQIRTILQDAWAIVAHHLSYKKEDDIPKELQRKLFALSGLFEIADDQFEALFKARTEYQETVKKSLNLGNNLSHNEAFNLESLLAYMVTKFPDRETDSREDAADLLSELNEHGINDVKLIDDAVNRAMEAVLASESEYPPSNKYDGDITTYSGVGVIRNALDFTNEKYRESRSNVSLDERYTKFVSLVKPTAQQHSVTI